MIEEGHVVCLTEYGKKQLYWWQFRHDHFRVQKFGRVNPREFTCRGIFTGWECVLTTDYVMRVEENITIEDLI